MIDVDTFLTALYVMVDNFCQSLTQKEPRPGPDASLSPSEVVTLAIFARWGRFASERDFYRYADAYLRKAFPTLPDRSQFNRLVRLRLELIEDTALHLATLLGAPRCTYEALDSLRRCPSGTPSVGARVGWPAMPTSGGLTAWGDTRASASWPLPAAAMVLWSSLNFPLKFAGGPTNLRAGFGWGGLLWILSIVILRRNDLLLCLIVADHLPSGMGASRNGATVNASVGEEKML